MYSAFLSRETKTSLCDWKVAATTGYTSNLKLAFYDF